MAVKKANGERVGAVPYGFDLADKEYAVLHPSPFWTDVLIRGESLVSDNPTVSFVVPVFIWFVVALRRLSCRKYDEHKHPLDHRPR